MPTFEQCVWVDIPGIMVFIFISTCTCRNESHLRQLIFLERVVSGVVVLCCVVLLCFVVSQLYMYMHVCTYNNIIHVYYR